MISCSTTSRSLLKVVKAPMLPGPGRACCPKGSLRRAIAAPLTGGNIERVEIDLVMHFLTYQAHRTSDIA